MTKFDTVYKLYILLYVAGLLFTGCLCATDKVLTKESDKKQSDDIVNKDKVQQNILVDPGGGLEEIDLPGNAKNLQETKGTTETEQQGSQETKYTEKQSSETKTSVGETKETVTQYAAGSDVTQPDSSGSIRIQSTPADPVPPQTATTAVPQQTQITMETRRKKSGNVSDIEQGAQVVHEESRPTDTVEGLGNTQEEVKVTEGQPTQFKDSTLVDNLTAEDKETEDVKPEADKIGQEEFQTFTEFFEENKEAIENKNKHNTLSDIPTGELSPPKPLKRKVNVASKECGAKVLSANPEAENTKGILTTNKDDYMINPCKVNKWFVIELCEPVRVKTLEVASFELFSSPPKTFKVHFSEEYPSKNWQSMEAFAATEARKLQSFPVPETFNNYIKFVKVELLDHYGEEHYCPLTLFRVLGVAVEYDDIMGRQPDDQDENMDLAVMNDIGEGESGLDKDGPKNLFASAKDTVLKIVQKVLNVAEKTEDGENKTNIMNDAETKNTTEKSFMLPCVPDVLTPHPQIIKDDDVTKTGPPTVDTEVKDIPKNNGVEVTLVTKLEDHEQMPSTVEDVPVVTLIDSEKEEPTLRELVSKCPSLMGGTRKLGGKKKGKPRRRKKYRSRLSCYYFQMMLKNGRVCPVRKLIPPVSGSVPEHTQLCTAEGHTQQSDSTCTRVPQKSESTDVPSSSNVEIKTDIPVPCLIPTTTESKSKDDQIISKSVTLNTQSQATPTVEPSSVVESMKSSKDIQHSVVASVSETPQSIKPSTTSDVKGKGQEERAAGEVKSPTNTRINLEPSIVEISPDVTSGAQPTQKLDSDLPLKDQVTKNTASAKLDEASQTGKTTEQDQSTATQTKPPPTSDVTPTPTATDPESKDTLDKEALAMEQMIDKLSSVILEDTDDNATQKTEQVQEKTAESVKKDLGLVKVPVLPYPKREIALMRLANRINALEMNVSLSIRFLERMSQKFKSKSDEMMKLLNKTDRKLEQAINESILRDKIQQEQINNMENRLEKLSNMVYKLTLNMDALNQKVTDRQMVWTTIEVVILFVIFLVCLRRGKPGTVSPDVHKLIEQKPIDPDPNLLVVCPRRNSFGGSTKHDSSAAKSLGKSLQKYKSETALACNVTMATTDISTFDPGGTTPTMPTGVGQQKEGSKKKKKKRKSQDMKTPILSKSMLTNPKTTGETIISNTYTNFNSAGLLFGSNQGEVTSDSDTPETLSRSSSYGRIVESNTARNGSGKPDTTFNVPGKAVTFKCVQSHSQKKVETCALPATSANYSSNSVISAKPPKGNYLIGSKVKKGSPPVVRATTVGGGQTGIKTKKHSIPNDHIPPGSIAQTIGPRTFGNGIHRSSDVTGEVTQMNRISNGSSIKRTQTPTADFAPSKTSSVGGWRKLIGIK